MLNKICGVWNRVRNERSGQGMMEYVLIIAAVAAIIVVALRWFGEDIAMWFQSLYQSIISGV